MWHWSYLQGGQLGLAQNGPCTWKVCVDSTGLRGNLGNTRPKLARRDEVEKSVACTSGVMSNGNR